MGLVGRWWRISGYNPWTQAMDHSLEEFHSKAKVVVLDSGHVFLHGLNDIPLAFILLSTSGTWAARLISIAFNLPSFAFCAT